MNLAELKDKWNVMKDVLKQRYTELNEDDFVELFGRLQEKLGTPNRGLLNSFEKQQGQVYNNQKP